MTELPVVWLVSALTLIAAAALALNDRILLRARLFLGSFLVCLGSIAFILGLRLSFDIQWLSPLQPLLAVMAAPAGYLGYRAFAVETAPNWRRLLIWTGASVLVAVTLILLPIPVSPDFFILGINGLYLVLIAGLLRLGPDDYLHLSSTSFRQVRTAIYGTVLLLGFMIAVDGLLFAASLFATRPFFLELLSGASGVFAALAFFAALIGLPLLLRASESKTAQQRPASEEETRLIQAIDDLLQTHQLYRDNSLTLSRVARRLSVPARQVSVAINTVKGENFSRYINGYRIQHAKQLLAETDLPVTEVMFECGFISKSNFNSEFRRVTDQTPSQYRGNLATR